MELRKLFKGIAVVIDDQINSEGSPISKIIKDIEDSYAIRFLRLDALPSGRSIEALSDAVIVILDWVFLDPRLQKQSEDNVRPGATLDKGNDDIKIELITKLLENSFAPIVILTDEPAAAKDALDAKEIKPYVGGRIIVQRKSNEDGAHQIQQFLQSWLMKNHEFYVLKEWEVKAEKAKHDFFQAFGPDDVNWVDALWARLKIDDDVEYSNMLGEYLTRCIVSNMEDIDFDESILNNHNQSIASGNESIKKLVNIQTVKWSKEGNYPNHPHAGDLFYSTAGDHHKFMLSIRADCDYSRNSGKDLFYLKGQPLLRKEIEENKSKIDENGKIHFGPIEGLEDIDYENVDPVLKQNPISIDYISKHLKNEQNRDYINKLLNPTPKIINVYGKLRGRRNQFYLPISCPDDRIAELKDMIAIKFTFDPLTIKFKTVRDKSANNEHDGNGSTSYRYMGKLLSPYINEIQDECAQWIFRTGAMPTPDEFYSQS